LYPSKTDDSVEDDGADDGEVNLLDSIDWIALCILSSYACLNFVANMIENHQKGKACVLVRMCIVCRNLSREVRVRKQLRVSTSTSVGDLAQHVQDAFRLLDADGSGTIEEGELEALVDELGRRRLVGESLAERDVDEIQAMLLYIFNHNVNDGSSVTPGRCPLAS